MPLITKKVKPCQTFAPVDATALAALIADSRTNITALQDFLDWLENQPKETTNDNQPNAPRDVGDDPR
jgi:hypothetical protein